MAEGGWGDAMVRMWTSRESGRLRMVMVVVLVSGFLIEGAFRGGMLPLSFLGAPWLRPS